MTHAKRLIAAACILVLAGCASQPKQTLLSLDTSTAAYASAECVQARQAALEYDDKMLGRVGVGLALGLLGPLGVVGAVAMDANQNNERKRLNEIIVRACTTLDGPDPE
jgi:hypothetical protein